MFHAFGSKVAVHTRYALDPTFVSDTCNLMLHCVGHPDLGVLAPGPFWQTVRDFVHCLRSLL